MSTLPLALQREAPASQPLRTGIALAVTVALFYSLCTLAWLVAPGPFMAFMDSLFHGLTFAPLLKLKASSFSLSGFVWALLVMSVWAFLAGTFFGWLRQRLNAKDFIE
ncbi:MAG: hypothetical protein KIT60_13925 [Burkholderiaceae bacterium]|nr:hypothetical protein [Burkholderiaceae bacterium]